MTAKRPMTPGEQILAVANMADECNKLRDEKQTLNDALDRAYRLISDYEKQLGTTRRKLDQALHDLGHAKDTITLLRQIQIDAYPIVCAARELADKFDSNQPTEGDTS